MEILSVFTAVGMTSRYIRDIQIQSISFKYLLELCGPKNMKDCKIPSSSLDIDGRVNYIIGTRKMQVMNLLDDRDIWIM